MIVKRACQHQVVYFLKNFKIQDFFCKDCICEDQTIDMRSVCMLQNLRTLIGMPIGINSAFRCKLKNARVGGKQDSPHLSGHAFDIYSIGKSGHDLARAAWEIGFRRIGIADRWCHVDSEAPRSGEYDFWVYGALNFAETKEKFLKDVGHAV